VNTSTAGIISATTPLWTLVLALAVRHQKAVTAWQGAGLIIGFGGGLLIFLALDVSLRADLGRWR
jgi:drug/metabolite transporter (DMT)-like permease